MKGSKLWMLTETNWRIKELFFIYSIPSKKGERLLVSFRPLVASFDTPIILTGFELLFWKGKDLFIMTPSLGRNLIRTKLLHVAGCMEAQDNKNIFVSDWFLVNVLLSQLIVHVEIMSQSMSFIIVIARWKKDIK